jgi:hypothetical protein
LLQCASHTAQPALCVFPRSQFDGADESGIQTVEPPIRIADYGMRAPQVDADSNDIDGVHSVSPMEPLGSRRASSPSSRVGRQSQ